jgi:hypothetical protein
VNTLHKGDDDDDDDNNNNNNNNAVIKAILVCITKRMEGVERMRNEGSFCDPETCGSDA